METLLIAAIFFFAGLVQSLTGFGSALISMPLLAPVLGLEVATPLVALMGAVLEAVLLLRFRMSLNLRVVWRLVIAALVGIPLGVLALRAFDERILLTILGVIVVVYALYALLDLKLPRLQHPWWAYGLGFLAGLLGGAYNTSGPPVIIYGTCRRWRPAQFKGNLQGFFLVVSLWVVVSHAFGGNLTSAVWRDFALGLPSLALGVVTGLRLDRHLDPQAFRKVVLVLLLALGARLAL